MLGSILVGHAYCFYNELLRLKWSGVLESFIPPPPSTARGMLSCFSHKPNQMEMSHYVVESCPWNTYIRLKFRVQWPFFWVISDLAAWADVKNRLSFSRRIWDGLFTWKEQVGSLTSGSLNLFFQSSHSAWRPLDLEVFSLLFFKIFSML